MTLKLHILLKTLIFCFLLFYASIHHVRAQDLKFHHITADQGYGFGNVWSIIKDHEGFMWFATEDGLIRYDGYNLVTYRNSKSDSNSISSNFSIVLLEDKYNQLWVGTFGGGLNLYDRDKDIFYRYLHDPSDEFSLPHNRVKTLIESQDGRIWVGTEGKGVVYFDPKPNQAHEIQFTKFEHPDLASDDPNLKMTRTLAEDDDGNMYVGSLSGITIINKERTGITRLRAGNQYPNILSSNQILEIFIDSKERIWIGTYETGLNLYLPDKQQMIHYYPSEDNKTLNHPEIESIAEDKDGIIWLGTDNGLSRMDDSHSPIPKNQFTNYLHEPLDENSLLSNSAKIVYVDNKNSLWIGTYYGGINIHNPQLYKFTAIRNKPWISKSLNHNNVTAFAEDEDHNLWIGTDGGGLSILRNAKSNMYQDNYTFMPIQSANDTPLETKVKTMEFDHNGVLWIGYWVGGLYSLNPQNGALNYYGPGDPTNSGLEGIRILDIKVDKNNNLWIGTFDQGISYYNQDTKKFKNYFLSSEPGTGTKGERFNAILVDSKERIWAGGDIGGLNLYDETCDCFKQIEIDSILNSNISILSLIERKDGTICIGTVASGIIIYDHKEKTEINYSEDVGLPNNVIHAMLEDESDNIWMGTNQGLAVLNTNLNTTTNYTRIDGLQGNQFNNGSCISFSNNMILFGGTNGWNAFYPDSISKSTEGEKIVFTNFWVNGLLADLRADKSPLSSHLNSDMLINLNHKQQSFSVEFAVLDFDFSNVNQYAYFLEGFDTDWQNISTDRKAIFTNMNPGEYKLHVKATNHDGFWIEHPKKLTIIIEHAWWQTRIFRVTAISLFVILLYSLYRIRINFLVNQSKKLEKLVQHRTGQLKSKNLELSSKNDEIQAQNEELFAQNEQISLQREELERTHGELRNINENLEHLVKKRTKKLESTIKQLDKTVLELDKFVYSASHDLSSPLKSVKGLIQIIKMEEDPERVQECIDHMIKSVSSLEDVIKSLVDYSKNNHLEIAKTPINCHNFLNDIIEELQFWPKADKVRIENNIDQNLIMSLDNNRLKIIFQNLIGNSIKYADHEKSNPYVKIDCEKSINDWKVNISDNGIGIEKKHLGKIFNMYYRASEYSIGSGLGLFIVKESVNKLNGKIDVQSEKGVGTTFTILFQNHK